MVYSKEKIIELLRPITYNGMALFQNCTVNDLLIEKDRLSIVIRLANNDAINKINNKELENLISQTLLETKLTIRIMVLKEANDNKEPNQDRIRIPGVKRVILIASGKGGVGKSTIASALAVAMSKLGRIGLVDADIYGSSIPYLFGLNEKPEVTMGNKLYPIKSLGVSIMSTGLFIEEDQPIIWRGPMLGKALWQLTNDTIWDRDGELDFLIIDTPPGTGDMQLTLATKYHIDGIIFITTPQVLAIKDTAKSITMFKKFNIKTIGVIENMSYLEGTDKKILGDNTLNLAKLGISADYLAKIPFSVEISSSGAISGNIFNLYVLFNELATLIKEIAERK